MKKQGNPYHVPERRSFAINAHFLELWHHPTNPLTPKDLKRLIKRNPAIWKRFEHYLKNM